MLFIEKVSVLVSSAKVQNMSLFERLWILARLQSTGRKSEKVPDKEGICSKGVNEYRVGVIDIKDMDISPSSSLKLLGI